MKATIPLLAATLASLHADPVSPALPDPMGGAEVRLPYAELRRLLDAARAPEEKASTPPVPASLLESRLAFDPSSTPLAVRAAFRAVNFGDGWGLVPLLAEAPSVTQATPAESRLVVNENHLCLLTTSHEQASIEVVFSAARAGQPLSFTTMPCPSAVLSVAAPPADLAAVVSIDGVETIFPAAGTMPLPARGGKIALSTRSRQEALALTAPPQPSTWAWQHQVAVILDDGELRCTALSRGAAAGGSGIEAAFFLPRDARAARAEGEDIDAVRIAREADGRTAVNVRWKTRDRLDRMIRLTWRLPVGPLDTEWKLPVPVGRSGEEARARFFLAESPAYFHEANGLAGPVPPSALPSGLAEELKGRPCHMADATEPLVVKLKQKAIAATDDAVVQEASWSTRAEAGGAVLTQGKLKVDHRGTIRLKLVLPDGFRLLSCTLGPRPVEPVELSPGTLEITLPGEGEATRSELDIACTARREAFHPVEGVCSLDLPQTPLFIHSTTWEIRLPDGYVAETHGNLDREPMRPNEAPGVLRLRKLLCRDERPAVSVFYNRAGLAE